MNANTLEPGCQTKAVSGRLITGRMKSQIKRFEKRYEISSAQMLQEVRSGKIRETEEIGRWIQYYLVLERMSRDKKKSTGQARLEHNRKLPANIS